jgi:predicted amidohydrolase YtcJ
VPGLNDSHIHVIRGGRFYNLELRWDGVKSLQAGLDMIREQAKRTPAGQWVRVVGGWSEYQFAERRLPTLAEINEVAPNTPVFVLCLYGKAFLNKAALTAAGITRDSPNPPGGPHRKGRERRTHGPAGGRAQRLYPLLHAGQGTRALLRRPAQLHAPVHA